MDAQKARLYESVARLGKALSSPKRLELIELLCQGERPVEALASGAGISVKLASAHLRELRLARLVAVRSEGKQRVYRLADAGVLDLWVRLRADARSRLAELQAALGTWAADPAQLVQMDAATIMRRARSGELTVLDVRAALEYDHGHLPHARSVPLDELRKRLKELPLHTPVVAYCRGPFCLMARDAVELLRKKGFEAYHLTDGVAEWQVQGLPIERAA